MHQFSHFLFCQNIDYFCLDCLDLIPSYHIIYRKPLNLSIDELRHVNENGSAELISPSPKDKNKLYVNGGGNSSGFNSAGDGSTCSNGTTPPPLGRSTPNVSSTNGLHQGSTVATISTMNFESLNDSDILEEPELQSAPWFQSGMPR